MRCRSFTLMLVGLLLILSTVALGGDAGFESPFMTGAGARAACSHTGSLAGSYEIYKTAFRQSGVIIADNVDELFDMADALAHMPPCRKNNIAIITNGGDRL